MVKMFCWELIWKEGPEVWEQEVRRRFKQEENSLSPSVGMLGSPCWCLSAGALLSAVTAS